MTRPRLSLLLAVLLLGLWPGERILVAAAPPTVTWGALTPAGSFNYAWTLAKTVSGSQNGGALSYRLQKGVKNTLSYTIDVGRSIDQSTVKMTVSGGFTITNNNAAVPPATGVITITTLTLTVTGGSGTETIVTPSCSVPTTLQPGGSVTCNFQDAVYNGYPASGTAKVTIAYSDESVTPAATGTADSASPAFSYDAVQGQFATALLTDTTDLSSLDSLYTGFTGFNKANVWTVADQSQLIPTSGITIADTTTKTYTVTVGSFVVCTGPNGAAVTNTATLTPQQSGTTGVAITKSATVNLVVWGCDLPPDVTFQNLQSWGAQTFTWAMTKRATQNIFNVQQSAGSLAVPYTLTATATPTTASYAVSGAVFVNNNQPGILNIARIVVQLSSGQQATPTCALTAPYVSSDGLVWGGVNAGGSITQVPFVGAGLPQPVGIATTANGVGMAGTLGTFTQFILPEFASATCTFNITIGAQAPSNLLEISPQLYWGFGGMYMLNKQATLKVNLNPPDNFFPVGGCISVTDVAQGGPLTLANGGPNNQQMCVQGNVLPYTQPQPITYSVTATINPTTTADCQPGGSKTYSITNTATATLLGQAGSPVTATADPPVTITVTCPKQETINPMIPQSTPDTSNLNVVVGGFQTYVAGEHAWLINKTVDDDTISLKIGQLPKTITYTLDVTKLPASNDKYFVYGKISVTNPGTQTVQVSSVSVTAGSAAVPATCPGNVTGVDPGVPLVCTFNVTWNNGMNSGSLGARVDTPTGSFIGEPASFDFTNPKRGGTRGVTADLYDDFNATAPANATGVPTKWWTTDGSEPPPTEEGVPLTTVDSRQYVYTVQVGPFADKGACGTYKLANTATLVPSDASSSKVTSTSIVSVSVTGCTANEFQAVAESVTLAVSGVTVTNVTSSAWQLDATAKPPAVSVTVGKTQKGTFTISAVKAPTSQVQVEGTVTVTNSAAAAVTLAGVTVSVEAKKGPAKTADAVCSEGATLQLAPGANAQCTFTVLLDASSDGDVIASAEDSAGNTYESPSLPYTIKGATVKAGTNAPDCAMVTTGMVVGVSMWQPSGAAGFTQANKKVCDTNRITVPVTVGPFSNNQCGRNDLTHVARLVPLGASAEPISLATPMKVTVRGCTGAGASAKSQPSIGAPAPSVVAQEVYQWSAKLTSNATNPLAFKSKEAVKVTFVGETQRSAAQSSVDVSGAVTLEAPATGEVVIQTATVAIYDGSPNYKSAPLDCGAAGKGGPISLKGKGVPVQCTYNATGLASSDGAVLPVIVPQFAAGPAPAVAAAYSIAGASQNIVGDCADLGSSLMLTQDGKRTTWQPAFVGQALSSGSDCEGGNLQRFSLWFGADAQGSSTPTPCGSYDFAATLTVLPTNGEAVLSEAEFAVQVTDC